MDGPSITPQMIVDRLRADGVLDDSRLVAMLGPARHDLKLNELEVALVTNGVISDERLLALKGALSGRPVLDRADVPVYTQGLSAQDAQRTGALLLDIADPTVAMVEDTPANVTQVALKVGRDDFDIWLVTATQFATLFKASYRKEERSVLPAATDIYTLFDAMLAEDGSDLHLSVGAAPMVRVDGELRHMKFRPLDQDWMRRQVRLLAGEEGLDKVTKLYDLDLGVSYGQGVRFRINVGADQHGITWAIRRLPSKIPLMENLGLPKSIRAMTELERGLVIVTGPTGSGKSTTLASMLAHICQTQTKHVLTFEDPIEFILPRGRSKVDQRQLGTSFTTFASALRQSLRQDPDVVLVGEARDRETISAAVTAAETGALVFTTLHTYDAASTLGRIITSFPEGEQDHIRAQLAYVLKGVVSQTLLPAVAGGRVAAFEILVGTSAVQNNLRKVDGLSSIRQTMETGQAEGMQTLEAHLASLVLNGTVREVDAEYKARDEKAFRRNLAYGNPLSGG